MASSFAAMKKNRQSQIEKLSTEVSKLQGAGAPQGDAVSYTHLTLPTNREV